MIRLPFEVAALLDAAAARVRRILMLRGVVVTLAAFLALTLIAMSVDAFFTIFDDAVRYAISSVLYLAVIGVAALLVVRPALRPISRRKAAKVLDERHPENEERFTTLVELAERAQGTLDNTSGALYQVLAREGVICANRIDLKREFTARTIRRRLAYLVGVLALLLASFVVFPNVTGLLFVRAVFPWVDVGNLYADYLEVSPGSVAVLKGTTVEIKARALKDLPGEMMIRISRKNGAGWGREYAEPLSKEGYREVASDDNRLWRYRVSCGPAVSRYYTVRVSEMPRYKSFMATLEYPAYTAWPKRVYTNESVGAIQAIAGTRVAFDLKIDEPGTTGEMRLSGNGINRLSDDGRLIGEMVSNRVAAWSMELTNADGFKSPKKGGPFVSVIDQPPTAVIERPRAALKLPPHAKLPVEYTFSDDVGLGDMVVRCAMNDDAFTDMRTESFEGHPALKRGTYEIDLSLFDLNDVSRIRFDFVVRDRYPEALGGPHAATSTPVTVVFDTQAKSFAEQNLAEQMKLAMDAMQEAEKRLNTAERLAREAKNEAERTKGEMTANTEKKVEQLAHEVAEAEKRTEELAEELEKDGSFEPIVENMEALAEKALAEIQQKVEEAQLAANDERKDALKDMQPILKEAREAMREAQAELKERGQQLEQYEKTRDLADRQQALAKAAEKIVAEKPKDLAKLDAWKRMEEAAARLTDDLARKMPFNADLPAAKREMEKAAADMKAFKEDKPQPKSDNHWGETRQQSARAEKMLKDAQSRAEKGQNANDALNHARFAENAVAERLLKNDAPKALQEAQKEAARALAEAAQANADVQAAAKENDAEKKEAAKAALQEKLDKALAAQEDVSHALAEAQPEAAQQKTAATLRNPAEMAREAADDLATAAHRQAERLGIDEDAEKEGDASSEDDATQEDDEQNDDEQNDQSASGASQRSEKRRNRRGGGSVGKQKRLEEEIAQELERRDAPKDAALRGAMRNWFRIHGAVKEGLGERDLKDIPAEYRDLVRRYFLRLVEENPASGSP